MAVQTEPKVLSDALAHEYEERMAFCREKRTAKSGETFDIGDLYQLEVVDVDEVQTLTVTGVADGGTYTLRIWDVHDNEFKTTAAIAYDADLSTVQAAIDLALTGVSSGVVASGTPITDTFVLTYSGAAYSGIDVPLATVPNLPTTTTVAVFAETTKGSVTTAKAIRAVDVEKIEGMCTENLGTLTADTESAFLERGPAVLVHEQLDYNSLDETRAKIKLKEKGILVYNEAATLAIQTT